MKCIKRKSSWNVWIISDISTDLYSENDLLYIGKIASSLPADIKSVTSVADEETIGFTLGTVIAKTLALGNAMGVSAAAVNTVKGAVARYQENYMDLIDKAIKRTLFPNLNLYFERKSNV